MWSNGEGKLTWARRRPCPLIVAHVRLSLPVSVRCCPCPGVVAGVRALLPVSARCCLRLFTFVGSHFRSLAVFVHTRPSLFVGVRFRGWSPSFMGGRFCVWALVFTRGQSPSFVGELAVGAVWWWVVGGWWWVLVAVRGGGEVGVVVSCRCVHLINEYDERRPMSSFVVWLPCRS